MYISMKDIRSRYGDLIMLNVQRNYGINRWQPSEEDRADIKNSLYLKWTERVLDPDRPRTESLYLEAIYWTKTVDYDRINQDQIKDIPKSVLLVILRLAQFKVILFKWHY